MIPSEKPGPHIQGDVLPWLEAGRAIWDMMIAFPPCTYLAVSGARWFKNRQKEQAEALRFVKDLMNAPIRHIALENPVGIISSKIRKPDQVIHPWQFGQSFEKTTCLWLKDLPKLTPTKIVDKGEFHTWVRKNNTPTRKDLKGKIMRVPKWYFMNPSPDRGRHRSRTFQGIADAMAEQWGEMRI